jgi:hypothetical protein
MKPAFSGGLFCWYNTLFLKLYNVRMNKIEIIGGGERMAHIPETTEFEQPILNELKKRGGTAYWREIINPVADALGISVEDREIMSKQKKKPKPVFVVRLRWASVNLQKRKQLKRARGMWVIT